MSSRNSRRQRGSPFILLLTFITNIDTGRTLSSVFPLLSDFYPIAQRQAVTQAAQRVINRQQGGLTGYQERRIARRLEDLEVSVFARHIIGMML